MKLIILFSLILSVILIFKENQIANISINCDICCDIFEDIEELNFTIKSENITFELNNSHKINLFLNKSKSNSLILSYNNFIQNNIFSFKENSICSLFKIKNNEYQIKNVHMYSKNTFFLLENFSFSIKKSKLRKLLDCGIEYIYYFPLPIRVKNEITISLFPKYKENDNYPTISSITIDPNNDFKIDEANDIIVFTPSDNWKYKYPNITLNYSLNSENCKDNNFPVNSFIICPDYCSDCNVNSSYFEHKLCYSDIDFDEMKKKINGAPNSFENETIYNSQDYFFHIFHSNYTSVIFDMNNYKNKYCSGILYYYLTKTYFLPVLTPENGFIKIETYENINDNFFNVMLYNNRFEKFKTYQCKNFALQVMNLTMNEKEINLNFLNYITPDYQENSYYYLRITFQKNTGYPFNEDGIYKIFGSMFQDEKNYEIGDYKKVNSLIYKRNGYYYNELYYYRILYELMYDICNKPDPHSIETKYKIICNNPNFILQESLNITVYPYYCYNVDLWYRICYTNYSLTSIQNEIEEKDLINLQEHIYETIHGDNFEVKIYYPSKPEDIQPHLKNLNFTVPDDYPLNLCPEVYEKSTEGLIIIEYKYENEYFYEIYDNKTNEHKLLDIGICYEYHVIEENFIIVNNETLIFNINEHITPRILDSNKNTTFHLEIINNNLNPKGEINVYQQDSTSDSISREYIYLTNNHFYYEDILFFKIYHPQEISSKKMEGNYSIYVFPYYCNKLNSQIVEKICYTSLTLDSIKKQIFADSKYDNFSSHLNEKVFGINYNLEVKNKDLGNCSIIYKNVYNTIDFIHFDIIEGEKEYTEIYANNNNNFNLVNQELCNTNNIKNPPKIIEINGEYTFNPFNNNIIELILSSENLGQSNDLAQYSLIIYKKINSNYIKVYPNRRRNLELIITDNFNIVYRPDEYKYYNVTFKYVMTYKLNPSTFEEINLESEITFHVFPSYCESHNQMICNSNTNIENILYILNNDYQNFENHNGEIIKNNDYYLQINNINNNKKNYVEIIIGFDNCKQEIRNKYNLNENNEIYIIYIKNTNSDKITFKIYSPLIPNELEIKDICQSIEVETPIHFFYNLTEYNQLLNQGIDPFNINSPFYSDLCRNHQIRKRDILLYDRLYNFYPNISVCSVNCDYQSFDLKNTLIKCSCPFNQIINLNIYGSYIDFPQNTYVNITNIKRNKNYLKNFNFKILKCFKVIKDNIINNIGFWIMSILLMTQFISTLTYFLYSIHRLNHIIKIPFINSNIEKRQLFKKNNHLNSHIISSGRELYIPKLDFNNKHLDLHLFPEKKIYELSNYSISYSYALYKEKRTFFEMFDELIKEKLPILNCFFKKYIFELNSVNVSLAIIHISLILNLNIVFYNNNIISKRFYRQNHFIYDLIRIILSSILTRIFFIFFKSFSTYDPLIEQLIFELKTKKNYVEATVRFLKKIKIKLGILMVINLLIVLFFFYYTSTFCAIYQENQINWIIGGVISLLINYFFIFIFCLLIVYWRKKSLRRHDEMLYNITVLMRNNL